MAKSAMIPFYHSALWQKQREYILKRDRYRCTELGCGNAATEVHHIIELTEDNVNDPNISLNENNLRSLCHDCHTKITYEMKNAQRKGCCLERIAFDVNGYPVALKN